MAKNPVTEGKTKIYYAASEDTQVSYQSMMKEQGIEVVFQTSALDTHLYQKLESKNNKVEFLRIDSELNNLLINQDRLQPIDLNNETDADKLKEIFDKALNSKIEAYFYKESYAEFIKKHTEAVEPLTPYLTTKEDQTTIQPYNLPEEVREKIGSAAWKDLFEHVHADVKVEVKSLKSESISGMIVFNEFMRRWHDMDMLQNREGDSMLKNHTLMLNGRRDHQKNPVPVCFR